MRKIAFFILIFSYFCFSKVFIKDEIKIDTSNEEVFAIGENIKINGILKNEFIGLGKDIEGDFTIYGDFLSAGLNQKISANIENDFYSIGNRIFFTGKIGGSFTCMARSLNIENSEVKGDLRIMANKISLKDIKVFQKSSIYGGKIKIKGIYNNVILHGEEIEIEEGTKILGDLIYYSPRKISYQGVEIKGKVKWEKSYGERVKEKTEIFKKVKFLYSFFSLVFPYFLLLIFTPNLLKSTTLTSGRNFIKSFILGLFFIIAFSFFILIFLITIIGVPTGLILTTFFISALYISRGFIFVYLARMIFYKFDDVKIIWFLSIFVGILIFNLISLNSTLKIISNIISAPVGFGALLIDRVKLLKKLKEEKII